ncbi:hypothetical protein CsSME_00040307 [Camellia sinensis var. sinensis]
MITLVALLCGRVTQEDTAKRPRIQLTMGRRMVMNKAHTPKGFWRNRETRRVGREQNLKRSVFVKNLGRQTIDEESCRENNFPPNMSEEHAFQRSDNAQYQEDDGFYALQYHSVEGY